MANGVNLAGRKLILASASPRRKELLSRSACEFSVIPSAVDETISEKAAPVFVAEDLAERKAAYVAKTFPDAFVLGADTVVCLEQEAEARPSILGKPGDFKEACSMLKSIQGRSHIVITGFCLICLSEGYRVVRSAQTRVWFRALTDDEIQAYASTGEPLDKAGAYGIQGLGGLFIRRISGSYSNVMGLPICEVLEELKLCGFWSASFLS